MRSSDPDGNAKGLTIGERINKINDKKPSSVKLVAVSKYHSSDEILQAIAEGQKVYGENRVADTKEKWNHIRELHDDIELHLVGRLQTNKARDAVALFDYIDVVDSAKLANKLKTEMDKQQRYPKCLVQVNVGGEEQKGGVMSEEANALIEHCKEIGLPVEGLMCHPPLYDPECVTEEEHVKYFELLSRIADENGLQRLSMGTSADYQIAIKCGATEIRLGTEVFGPRNHTAIARDAPAIGDGC